MEVRPASSPARFRGQWSFLSNPPQHAQPRSVPPSSYLPHSDRSSISQHQQGPANGSRSSLPRNLTTASTGARSSATAPSQPVLIRVHSADASAHLHPTPRPRRPINMHKPSGLPAISEFSIQGILNAIHEDVEQDVNTISEILGRSRLVLADQHDSHMPPQGEIRAMPGSLQGIGEATLDDERFASDDVLILREDASLVDGSQAGSAAYGLLERLQTVPRASRMNHDIPNSRLSVSMASPPRSISSPAILHSEIAEEVENAPPEPHRASRQLLQTFGTADVQRTTNAVVSETYLYAGADGTHAEHASVLGQLSSQPPFESVDEAAAFEQTSDSGASASRQTFRERMQNLLYVSDPTGLSAWLHGQTRPESDTTSVAEGHLRELLERQSS